MPAAFATARCLSFPDLVGFTNVYLPKFVRQYADTHALWLQALQKYIGDVQNGDFPNEEESYHLNRDIDEFLK